MKLAWSNLAREEMVALRRYSVDRWGQEVAQSHLDDVRLAAGQIAANPAYAKKLRDPFRAFRVRSHCLLIHVDEQPGRVTIARVLHVAMDIDRHLP